MQTCRIRPSCKVLNLLFSRNQQIKTCVLYNGLTNINNRI